jgi:hypothetical protein
MMKTTFLQSALILLSTLTMTKSSKRFDSPIPIVSDPMIEIVSNPFDAMMGDLISKTFLT